MASYLQVENVSKSYGPRVLFNNINMNINEGDKIALIAPNGTGKTSLLRILAGVESSDGDGKVKFLKDIQIAFLAQDNVYDPALTIWEVVSSEAKNCQKHEIEEILYSLKLFEVDKLVSQLSGGEVKRVAIACMFVKKPQFLVMDEPTNHLDLESIEYLEDYFTRQKCTLLMVTHDRYFLDRVCNQIIEMADGTLYSYDGNYSYYLQKREERMANMRKDIDRARNLLRTELDWMRRMPCARGTKAKYRIDAFYDLKDRASQRIEEKNFNINVKSSRLGKKIVNCSHVDFKWGDWTGLKDFTYNFAPGEKIGIVGKNGIGKSTFLNIITGELAPTAGEVQIGETVSFGYYKQQGIEFNPNDTVIEAVREIAEVVTLGDGKSVPVTTFLNYFLFPPNMHYNKIEKLSGGEKRRLYLLTVLMKNPNVLILDEPTNDLDILTLNVLEEYLKEFKGSVIIVSHDRFFLDKIADHLFVFEGDGIVKDFVGSYSGYREYIKEREKEKRAAERAKLQKEVQKKEYQDNPQQPKRKKLSYKEQRELEQLEKDLEALGMEKAELEEKLSGGELQGEELQKASVRIGEVLELLDEKELRWLELNDN
ncbi:MAG: ABC-F family ATP-binding cassette domain-containing protein [Bacteroidales bacterium]|nr:ABC-F family ATP-binding cassette domain-containing protein [Bacteroidales bacterium]